MLDVSRLLNLHWTIIKEVLKSFLAKKYDKPDLRNITMISIDEISTHKRHKYVTIVINAETGQPLFVGDGKSEESLAPFWEMLGPRRRKRIQAVAIDMGIAYISAVKKNLPNAKIVFDHFHVIKLVNEALNSLRRKVYATASSEDKTVLAGTKYLLLQNPETFPEDSPKAERLKQLLALNTPLTCGYILKEDIRQIWQKKNKLVASRALAKWIETARSSGEELLIKLANTIERHSEGILNWYDHAINSGLIEGINNKIKVMKRKAYGFADMPFFKLLIKAIRGTRQELILRT
jgi:transposase